MEDLDMFREMPLVRVLIKEGQEAQVRYLQTDGFQRKHGEDMVYLAYDVTYQDGGEKKSLVISVEVRRTQLEDGRANWVLSHKAKGTGPDEW